MNKPYDVIVVGARCAGSPTAMLLARKGYRVLVVDRATFPSDTVSTHVLHPLGVAALAKWGLLERLAATGCPPIGTFGFAAAPTHDGLTLTVGGWPYPEFAANKADVEGNFMKMFDLVPEFADRVRTATRVAPFAGTPVPGFFRKPFGPGWALVGDAGYNKDPITAQGINDAFRDAERCVVALHQALSGGRPFDEAMSEYQRDRDHHVLPMYEMTCQLATLEPPPPEVQQLFAAIPGNQQAMDGFAQMNAGTISPAQFFSPENVGAIKAAARADYT